MRLLPSGLFAVAWTLAAVSCTDPAPGTSADAGAGDAGPPVLGENGKKFLADLCGIYEPCCEAVPASAGTCARDAEDAARGLTFDEERAATCLEALRAESKDVGFCSSAPTNMACAAVFKAPSAKAPGSACRAAQECSNGPDGDGVCIFQKCRRTRRGDAGARCLGTRAPGRSENLSTPPGDVAALCYAMDGLYCDATGGACKARGAIGADCAGSDVACVDDGWCPTTTNQCAKRTATQDACSDPYECALGARCAADGEGGDACNLFAGEGGDCERGDECDARRGLVCDPESTKCVKDLSRYDLACRGRLALFE